MPIASQLLDAPRVPPARPLGKGPIVVATDGSRDCDAALDHAWSLAGCTCADVQVLSVLPWVTPTLPDGIGLPGTADLGRDVRDDRMALVREQVQRALPAGCDWPIALLEGAPGDAVARYARIHDAQLIVTGRGRHGRAARLATPETVLRILRLADAPVLAVHPDASGLPRRLVIGTDFTAYSTYAARVALSMAAPGAVVYLAHVLPRTRLVGPRRARWERAYEQALPAMFDHLRAELALPTECQVEAITLSGDPGSALVDFATSSHADLVVSGTHGAGFLTRLLVGSVATDLLRGAPCSLLCVPGSAVTHVAARTQATTGLLRTTVPPSELSPQMAAFTERNAGRPCECARTGGGPTRGTLASAMPLVGIDCDAHDDIVTLSLGALRLEGPHLTHTVHRCLGAERLVDAQGVDRGLDLLDVEGTTILRFLD